MKVIGEGSRGEPALTDMTSLALPPAIRFFSAMTTSKNAGAASSASSLASSYGWKAVE